MDLIGVEERNAWQNEGDAMATEKPLKKKKSLPRIFILSRKKSTKSKSPAADRAAETTLHPLPASRLPSETSIDTVRSTKSKDGAETPNTEERVLRDIDGNVPRNAEDYSPKDMTDVDQDKSMMDDVNLEHQDENLNLLSHVDQIYHLQSSPLKTQVTSDQIILPKRPRKNLHISPSLRLMNRSKPPLPQQQQASFFPPRPYTAIQDRFPENARDPSEPTPIRVGSARQADEDDPALRRSPILEQWVPWQESYMKEDGRKSTRSGLSTGSSAMDSSGSTEHSSIFTKMSSVSDMTIDLDDMPCSKHASMTVDDAIDLYSAGFDDDFDLKEGDPMKSPCCGEEIRRRSVKIAEAMNEKIDSVLLEPPRSIFAEEPRSSADIISGAVFQSIFPRPPSIQTPNSTHDQYGFLKASRDVTITQYDTWHNEYGPIQERRTNKWIHLMQDQGLSIQNPTRFPSRSAKTQRFIRKGIPPSWRGSAWFFYAGGDALLNTHRDLYPSLVLLSQTPKLSSNDKESIERDLNRTFPDNLHFKPDPPLTPTTETPLLSSLRRVLCAFAVYHPRIGYCQSLNFLAGLLLLFLPEEKAFWLLHIITTRYLPGTHDISLEGANVDLWVLMLALKDSLPSIWDKIGGEVQTSTTRLPPISLCTTSWFMSLFIGTLPIESVLRVWDVLFYEGSRTLFRVALGIFKLGENEIRGVSDPMEIFQVVQGLPRRMVGIGALMAVACRRGGVGQAWVEKKRAERREWYAKERKGERLRKDSRDWMRGEEGRKASRDLVVVLDGVDERQQGEEGKKEEEEGKRVRANSGWRSRIGFGRG